MKMFYFESDLGCGIREARNLEAAERSITREVGYESVGLVRLATDRDIAWVSAMGGYVPKQPATLPPAEGEGQGNEQGNAE
jgi:hypothetical protein